MQKILGAFAATMLLFAAMVSVVAQTKGTQTTIRGEVVDLWC